MCNMCAKRKSRRRKRSIGKLNTDQMIKELAGVGGAAVASASDAIFQKISFLDDPGKVGIAKGVVGWILSNNPMEIDALDNDFLAEFGKGMMYYGWGQIVADKLNLQETLSKAGGNSGGGNSGKPSKSLDRQGSIPNELRALIAGNTSAENYYSDPIIPMQQQEVSTASAIAA